MFFALKSGVPQREAPSLPSEDLHAVTPSSDEDEEVSAE
jgi:hypothetical protein